jgi:hypothetical protein
VLLSNLEASLSQVLSTIPEMVETPIASAQMLSTQEMALLFDQLTPLLKSRSPESTALIPQLKQVPNTAELITQIENYDFRKALATLSSLQQG